MASSSRPDRGARVARALAALAAACWLVSPGVPALAQQTPAGEGAGEAGDDAEDMQSIWAKLCGETPDPKDQSKKVKVCTTQFEVLNREASPVMVGAITNIEGQDQELFSVTVPQGPQGVAIGAGVRVRIDQGDVISLRYTFCFVHGCMAEVPASKQLVERLKSGENVVIGLVDAGGNVLSLPVPLQGFGMAYDGQAVDAKKYVELRRQMIEQYRQTLEEEKAGGARQ